MSLWMILVGIPVERSYRLELDERAQAMDLADSPRPARFSFSQPLRAIGYRSLEDERPVDSPKHFRPRAARPTLAAASSTGRSPWLRPVPAGPRFWPADVLRLWTVAFPTIGVVHLALFLAALTTIRHVEGVGLGKPFWKTLLGNEMVTGTRWL